MYLDISFYKDKIDAQNQNAVILIEKKLDDSPKINTFMKNAKPSKTNKIAKCFNLSENKTDHSVLLLMKRGMDPLKFATIMKIQFL